MKALLVGLGSFGYIWYKTLAADYKDLQLAIVEVNEKMKTKITQSGTPFYTSLKQAIEQESPDFLINVTPPAIHKKVNFTAFNYGIPVLCEKPISDNYFEAIEIVEKAREKKVPLMIAENYRRLPFVRKIRKLIEQGAIGDIVFVHIDFYKNFHINNVYFHKLKDPLLTDVAIHHFDMMRYLTGAEGMRIFAKSYNPKISWFKENMCASVVIEMENGIMISFNGNMVSPDIETSWIGNWVIEGTERTLTLIDEKIYLLKKGKDIVINDFKDIDTKSVLDEFLMSLQEKRDAETSGAEYIKSQALVHFAIESSKMNKMLEVGSFINKNNY